MALLGIRLDIFYGGNRGRGDPGSSFYIHANKPCTPQSPMHEYLECFLRSPMEGPNFPPTTSWSLHICDPQLTHFSLFFVDNYIIPMKINRKLNSDFQWMMSLNYKKIILEICNIIWQSQEYILYTSNTPYTSNEGYVLGSFLI